VGVDESLFDQVGGEPFFVQLIDAFYDEVELDVTLRPMYPEDLSASRCHLTLFLVQYWGGPGTYQLERGHPRLRKRHVPFRITNDVRDAWLAAMAKALSSVRDQLSDEQFEELRAYFEMAAKQLTNA
jgi:hemoglobin